MLAGEPVDKWTDAEDKAGTQSLAAAMADFWGPPRKTPKRSDLKEATLFIAPLSLTWIPEKLGVITYPMIEEADGREKKRRSPSGCEKMREKKKNPNEILLSIVEPKANMLVSDWIFNEIAFKKFSLHLLIQFHLNIKQHRDRGSSEGHRMRW